MNKNMSYNQNVDMKNMSDKEKYMYMQKMNSM